MACPPVISEELAAFVTSGLSIAIGTRDADLAPEGARVWAALVEPDRAHLEVFLYAPSSGPTLMNLEACPQMAVVFDRPADHRACQLKGIFLGVRPARDDEQPELQRQFDALCISLDQIGFPPVAYARATNIWPAVVLRMRMTDAFHQDPGPGAGERLSPSGARVPS